LGKLFAPSEKLFAYVGKLFTPTEKLCSHVAKLFSVSDWLNGCSDRRWMGADCRSRWRAYRTGVTDALPLSRSYPTTCASTV
jgi:hypothetical protein